MTGPETRRIFYRIIPFGLIWLFTGWVFLFVEAAATKNFENQPSSAIRVTPQIFILASVAVMFFGMLTGLIEIKIISRLLRQKSFIARILYKLLAYSIIFTMIELISFPLAAALELNTSVTDRKVWAKFSDFFTSITHLSTSVQLGFSLMLSLFYTEISDYIGPRALQHFITGRYHRPVEEERVFMFLDMHSSTRLAEQLGHTRYFNMLRRYYADITGPLTRHGGEIHQYAGDEVVASWPVWKGIRDHACVRSFFAMQHALNKKRKEYLKQFGLVPSFKAGMHLGWVTTGEIGVTKKEILSTGDVLNSTARMQGLCNSHDATLLISAHLYQHLELPPDKYSVRPLGAVELKGRNETMELYQIGLAGGTGI